MLRILSVSSDEMAIDNGISISLLSGLTLIFVGLVVGTYGFSISYPSFDFTSISAAVVFTTLGMYFFLSSTWLTLLINKIDGKLLLYRKRVVGTRTEEYDIRNIDHIEWRMQYAVAKLNDAPPRGSGVGAILRQPLLQGQQVFFAQAVIVLKSRKELLLATENGKRQFAPVFTQAAAQTLSQLASFMQVPFKNTSSDSAKTE